MTHVFDRTAPTTDDDVVVTGRSFVQPGPQGTIDGTGIGGIYAHDLRLIRRLEVHRAEREAIVSGDVEVCETGCAARFVLTGVQPGTGVLMAIELDGTDLFDVRSALLASPDATSDADDAASATRPTAHPGGTLALGSARPDARVRLEVAATGAELVDRDGIARSLIPLVADGTARTGTWQWRVPADLDAPVDVTIELRAAWALTTDDEVPEARTLDELAAERRIARDAWLRGLPTLSGSPDLEQIYARTLADIEQLRIHTPTGVVLGAGAPWFLTVFGRDSILASWMLLPVDPEIARATLRYLARHQSTRYDAETDAEPGKILHEERVGVAAQRWHERYFGSVDATPLFLMLLAETHTWTGDDALIRELESPARHAVDWLLARIEDDELGLISYKRRASRGLDVQSWKDSPSSQRDHEGQAARGHIRPLEAQAYGVAALRGAARLATDIWDAPEDARAWRQAAVELEQRLLGRFLVPARPGRGAFFAQALDGDGTRLDATCSNVGHVLWANAIPDVDRCVEVAELLGSSDLWSGWGVRTMASTDAGYDEQSYHCGSVWPHDTAIAVAGMASSAPDVAARVGRGLLDAAARLHGQLPEYLSGAPRSNPDASPGVIASACRPQAWAAASPLLVLRALLGLGVDASGELVASAERAPTWLGGMEWRNVIAHGARWEVAVNGDGSIDVTRLTDA